MKVFGLTGGIATGKSTVSRFFAERGVPIIDADLVAREVLDPGTEGLREVAKRFPGTVSADGLTLDRKALGERIFGEAKAAERAALNAIVHPRIQARVLEQTLALAEAGTPLVIYDAPLLIENHLHEGLHGVVLVTVPEAVQRSRLMQRNQLDEAAARARIASQLPLDQKRQFATWVIDNGGTLEQTRAQVDSVLAAMRAMQ